MAALTYARVLSPDDAELLAEIDRAYAERYGLEPILTRSSLSFFVRSGHSFVALNEGAATGFALAQAVWNGTRPAVVVSRLATGDDHDLGTRLALIEAITKSAYDAAVYDIQVQLSSDDHVGARAFQNKQYHQRNLVTYERILGSRGQQ
ncbi:MAG: DUF1999 family protein [Trueperaceae bacterium]|nr:DUF1999 family protein [Trueperaceae bacterium]